MSKESAKKINICKIYNQMTKICIVQQMILDINNSSIMVQNVLSQFQYLQQPLDYAYIMWYWGMNLHLLACFQCILQLKFVSSVLACNLCILQAQFMSSVLDCNEAI
jgi:hypothetical protein